ncbi:leucine-rich repeat-containing protein 58-like [Anopheles moucheti]|uniref:leucine-rich repeat-containing protein 58-like n=1 Tax=Anopheles moucheti TaxID=186751 RepID=UPI0022EFE6CE|nr:leucine-rich repeat-containing protein 58-like [Anopheles moucheti]
MLEATSGLFNDITLEQYHEYDLAITNRMTSESITLNSAPLLTHLQVVPNRHLRSLRIVNNAVRSIPETIANLPNLQFLGIEQAFIRVLDLGLLCALPKLKTLQMINNHIGLVLPAHGSSCGSPLQDVLLERNHLTTLDMAVFAPFVAMTRLFLQHNHMKSIFCSNATSLPLLELISLGPGNNLSWIDFELLHLPASLTLDLKDNRIKQLPFLNHHKMPALARVYLDGNQLSTVDLAQFHRHQQIDGFYFPRNQLHYATCSQYVHLPLLSFLQLSENMLESISLENCSFPNLRSIALDMNRIQYIPVEIYVGDVSPSCVLSMRYNPIRCTSLQTHAKLLTTPQYHPKLLVTNAARCVDMKFNGQILISEPNSACCMV